MTDPRIYGAPEFSAPLPQGVDPATQQYQAPEKVSVSAALPTTPSVQEGLGVQAQAIQPKASALASVGAAISEWSPRQMYDYFTGPKFTPDPTFNVGEAVIGYKQTLDDTERKFLMSAQSQQEFDYRAEAIDRQRMAFSAIGNHPILGFSALMLDPGYLAIDMASLGVGRLARIAKLGRGFERMATAGAATAGVGAMGLVQQQVEPISDTEIVLNALISGAASGAIYRGGKLHPDEGFPAAELNAEVNGVRSKVDAEAAATARHTGQPLDFTVPKGESRSAVDLLSHVEARVKGTPYEELVNAINRTIGLDRVRVHMTTADQFPEGVLGANTRTGVANDVFLAPDSTVETALHELLHATVQQRVKADPLVLEQMQKIKANVLKQLKASKDPALQTMYSKAKDSMDEFLSYSLTSPEFQQWARENNIGHAGVPTTWWHRLTQTIADAIKAPVQTVRNLINGVAPASLRARQHALLRQADSTPGVDLRAIQPGTGSTNFHTRPTQEAVAAEVSKRWDQTAPKVANWMSWSLHKSLAAFGSQGKKTADLWVDNPLNMGGDSIVSQTRAVRAELSSLQYVFEDLVTKELANRGYGTLRRAIPSREAKAAQMQLERELSMEMLARDRESRLGLSTPRDTAPAIKEMADALDNVYAKTLDAMQKAGVKGADEVQQSSGYFSRKWDITRMEQAKAKLQAAGYTEAEAGDAISRIISQGLRKANGWESKLSDSVAKAIVDRTRRKGYFEDAAFHSHVGNAAAKELRDMLETQLNPSELERVMSVVTGVSDEAGKLSSMKRRLDIDMNAGIPLKNGESVTVADLIDPGLVRLTDSYLDQVSGRIGMARKGIVEMSDIDKSRTAFLEGITEPDQRGQAAKLFDQMVDSVMGRPVGEDMPQFMRNSQAFTRTVGLAGAGLWQLTEYAPIMARFGAVRTMHAFMKHARFKAFRDQLKSGEVSSHLVDILTNNAAQDIRIRPYVDRLEDNFEVPTSAVLHRSLLQAQQLVPYINGMKLVMRHQSVMTANLIVDTINRAAKGDAKAMRMLGDYGLESRVIEDNAAALRAAAGDTAKWPDGLWEQMRGPLNKMVDDAVLRSRTGEIPAFAQFSAVGKFIFTFRSYVLAAHNKIMAGTLSREGLAGLSLLLLYQMPLAMLATEANAQMRGKQFKDDKELAAQAISQMGAIGLFSELWGAATGQKQQFGAPGLIAIDRLYKLGNTAFQGDVGGTANALIQATPLLGIMPAAKAIGNALKE